MEKYFIVLTIYTEGVAAHVDHARGDLQVRRRHDQVRRRHSGRDEGHRVRFRGRDDRALQTERKTNVGTT